MSWVRLDDRMPTHPKVVGLSDRAFRLLVRSWCYCALHETDGLLSGQLAGERGHTELLRCGLWEAREDGTWVHDFLDLNASRATRRLRAAGNRERQDRYRNKTRNALGRWSTDDP